MVKDKSMNDEIVIQEFVHDVGATEDNIGAMLLNVIKDADMKTLYENLNGKSPKECLLTLMNWLHKWQQEYQCVMESLLQYIETTNNGQEHEENAEEIKEMDVEAKEILNGFEILTLELLKECKDATQVDAMDDMGWTLLMQAANFGSIAFVQKLLENHASPSIRQHQKQNGMHALARAVDVGHLNVVELLTTADTINAVFEYSNQDEEESEVEMHTPLTLACRHGHEDIVHFFLSQSILDVNQHLPESGDTALHIATCFDHYDLVQELVKRKDLQINAINTQGYTAVFGCSNADIVQLLLSNGLDALISGNEGETALDLAIALEDEEVAELLDTHISQQ
ncbi:hypothetical protein THRCLA_00709 [Thraustotheca clavata]|uniref:Uncharacterized protein n=1 Tax=Thraustotheca clavata TaxID=74557 RepID=A0A1W0AAT5_9STRA|nr:hypothetical protein THRCLA_00709 [Thraustotheca clavata]